MRRLLLVLLLASACSQREPPPGSGALETTPVSSAPVPARTDPTSAPTAIACPNGSVLVTDPKACRVEVLFDGKKRWGHQLSGCEGFLEAAAAMDSSAYVRTAKTLAVFDPDGGQRWSVPLDSSALIYPLLAPTALADSRVAVATTPAKLAVYELDGKIAWGFSAPSGESFLTAPVGMKTEGLIVSTSHATYLLSANGEIRWRVQRPGVAEQ